LARTHGRSTTELDPPTRANQPRRATPSASGLFAFSPPIPKNSYRYQKNTRHDRARRPRTDLLTPTQPPSTSRKTFLSSTLLLNLARPATRQNWRASHDLAKSVVVACSRCASLDRGTRSNVAQMRFALFLPNVAARTRLDSTARSLRPVNNSTHNHTAHFDKKHAQKETRLAEFVSLCRRAGCLLLVVAVIRHESSGST
jgi:hypothetical protein